MSYIQLPRITYKKNIEQYIECTYSKNPPIKPFLNKTLYTYLNFIKCEIDSCQNEWDKYKKYTNPYEYIHTPVAGSTQSICKLTPLSRSYYKMIEICNMLSIVKELPSTANTFHLAEGPGGFIEALADMRKDIHNNYHPNDRYYGMTLLDDKDSSVPGWEKTSAFIKKCPNFSIETAQDGRGDLTNPNNLLYCYNNYKNSMDLITADGGFDFSIDFNQQEIVSSKLIFFQITFAIAMQKKGGSFIIKFFDTFTELSAEMIYLLGMLYDTVYFVKPCTSRQANSEKYLVCKGFRLVDTRSIISKILQTFNENSRIDNMVRMLNIKLPYILSIKIEECNAMCGQQQIECISNTLNLIDNNKYDKLESLKKNNVQKCKQWCQKYRLPYHKNIAVNNIFLQKQ